MKRPFLQQHWLFGWHENAKSRPDQVPGFRKQLSQPTASFLSFAGSPRVFGGRDLFRSGICAHAEIFRLITRTSTVLDRSRDVLVDPGFFVSF